MKGFSNFKSDESANLHPLLLRIPSLHRLRILLPMVNLAINDYYSKKLKVIQRKISLSASERGKLDTAKDAEMHHSLTMNNADSESPTSSMKEKARNIGRENQLQKIEGY